MSTFPSLVRSASPAGEARYELGDPLVDRYLEFVAGRCRPNTLTATAFDLKTFFTVVDRDPLAVTPADVFEFLAAQRGDRRVVRMSDRESGLSTRRQAGAVTSRTVPLVRVPRTLPKILSPVEVDSLVGALRSWRDRAMVEAMLLGGLRRCEVLGLRLV